MGKEKRNFAFPYPYHSLGQKCGRKPDQSAMHYWGQRSRRGQLDQPEVKFTRNVPWLPNYVGRTPDQSLMQQNI